MGSIATAFEDTWRDFVTPGIPGSGAHEPAKAAIRAIGPLLETALGVGVLGGADVTYATRAELDADLGYAADSVALVYADPTDDNNDLYVKTGGIGAGGWTLTATLHTALAGLAAPYLAQAVADAEAAAQAGADLAAAWAAGTLPGGADTFSAREYAETAEGHADDALTYADTVAGQIGAVPGAVAAAEAAQAQAEAARDAAIAALAGYAGDPIQINAISVAALKAVPVAAGKTVFLIAGTRSGPFEWVAGDKHTLVDVDPQELVWIAPDSDPTGTTGVWQRVHMGVIRPEWGGENVGTGGDDTTAVQAADELLRERDEFKSMVVSAEYTTRGFGDLIVTNTYATKAAADAALGGMADYEVAKVTTDETDGNKTNRYRVIGGAFVKLSRRSYNGKSIIGLPGASKRTGFKLASLSPSWMRLYAASFAQGAIVGVLFNGDCPTLQWSASAPQNNPLTELLVQIEGYGVTWHDSTVRFSGGDGVDFRGLIGVFHISGGDCAFSYSHGRAIIINQMSALYATQLWVEGNDGGDIYAKYDIALADSNFATKQSYWRRSGIFIGQIYSENANDNAHIFVAEGGHLAPRVGKILKHGTGTDRLDYYLKDGADAEGIYKNCTGGVFWCGQRTRIVCESAARHNLFIRQGGPYSNVENGPLVVNDNGIGNQFEWDALDAASFTPGNLPGNYALNTDSTSFIDHVGTATGSCVPTLGGILHPVLDYHPDFTDGPGHMRYGNMASDGGLDPNGTPINTYALCNANLPNLAGPDPTTYTMALAGAFSAAQLVYWAAYDTVSGHWYDPNTQTWGASGSQSNYGQYTAVQADHRSNFYRFDIVNGAGVARTVRIQLRIDGPFEAEGYHALITDVDRPAMFAVANGVYLGTSFAPTSTTAAVCPADKVPIGTSYFDRTAGAPRWSNGAAYVAAA